MKKYLGKKKAKNILLDDHGGYQPGTTDPGIVINEDDEGITGNSFDIYPKNGSPIAKEAVSAIIGIGNSVTNGGNYIIASCLAGKGEKGTHLGERISSLVGGNTNLFSNTGFSRPSLLAFNIGGNGWTTPGNLNGGSMVDRSTTPQATIKRFNSGRFTGSGDLHLSQSGQVFKFQ